MDPEEHQMNHPSHCQFVGGIWGEKINAQRGYYGSVKRRY
jgi:hypothetical protein